MKSIHRITLLLLITTIYIVSCAGPATKTMVAPGTGDLLSSVKLEWDAKVKKDWGKVYDIAAASFKKKISRDNFLSMKKINVISYEILETVSSGSNHATTRVKYSVNQEGHVFQFTTREQWVLEDGQWRLNLLPSFNIPESK